MKRVVKSAEPQTLADFRATCPRAKWREMKNDPLYNGQDAYQDCRRQIMADQHSLCAYCERKIDSGKPHRYRVEHVYPKSKTTPAHNWALDWQNLLVTCDGGEKEYNPKKRLKRDNLSCDAAKGHGTIDVNPLEIPAFPNVFHFDKSTGHLEPDYTACAQASVDPDKLQKTINTLNLNCNRLSTQRRLLLQAIEKRKNTLREKGYDPQRGGSLLAQGYFQSRWPEFFTTLRCCLGQPAEEYLRSVNYNG